MGDRHDEPPEAPPGGRTPLSDARRLRRLLGAAARLVRPSSAPAFRALLEINKKLSAAAPTDALPGAIAEEAARLLDSDNAGLRLVDGDELVLAGFAGTAPQTMIRARLGFREGLSGRVATEARTVVADLETSTDVVVPEQLAANRRLGHTTYLGVPLQVGDRLIGVLSVRARRRFTDAEVELAEAFAGQAALALEQARLYRESQRQAERMAALAEVERLVAETLDADGVAQRIVDNVCGLLGARSAALYRLDEAAARLVLLKASGASTPRFEWTDVLVADHGIAGLAIRERGPVLTGDALADSRILYGLDTRGRVERSTDRALLGVPLLVRDHVFGALAVGDHTGRHFTEEDVRLAAAFAAQAAVALENARLHEESERRRRTAEHLADLGRLLSQSLDPQEVGERIVENLRRLLGVMRCALYAAPPGSDELVVIGFSNAPEVGRTFGQDLVFQHGVGAVGLAVRQRRLVMTPDVMRDPAIPLTREVRAAFEPSPIRAVLAVPLIVGDAVIGVLAAGDRVGRIFSAEEIRVLRAFADHAAVALDHVRLFAETRRRLDETRALLEVAEILNSTLDSERLLKRATMKIAQVCGVDRCSLELWNGDTVVPLMSQFADGRREPALWDAFRRPPPYAPTDVPAHARALATRRPVVIDDTAETELIPREWIATYGLKSYMVVPLLRQESVIGVMNLDYSERPTRFEDWQVDLAMTIGGQLALSLENTRLYAEAQARLRETETLLSVSRALSTTLDLTTLFRHFLRRVASTLAADSVGVFLLGEDGEWLEPHSGYHVPRDRLDTLRRFRVSIVRHAFYAEAVRTQRPVYSRNVDVDPRIPQAFRDDAPHRSQLFVPMVAQGRFIGGFAAVWWEHERELSAGELDLMEAIANQAAIAIANARLFEENRRQVEELSVLHELSRTVTGELDRAALIEAVATQVARVLDARHLAVMLVDEDRDELGVVFRIADGVRQTPHERYPLRSVGLQSVVLESGRPVRSDEYVADCVRYGVEPVARSRPFRYWLGVPMRAGDAILGVIALLGDEHPFTASDERVLTNIGQLAALQLRSARLFDERRRAYGELAAAQDQLVRTEKMRALGEMASGVAHDFNNVLAAVLGRAQLLQRYVTDSKLASWLQVIERSALDGAQTVRRLQEFARVRRDQPFGPVDLNGVIRDALEMTQSRWREDVLRQGVVIEARVSMAPLATVAGDPAELREVMTNLILNAVDAMPKGGTLHIGTAVVGDTVELTVSDTGVGIPAAVRDRIFDPFFTTKGPEGTGLGLSMTYGILSRHGARIAVDSVEGRGTTFRITFPRGRPLVTPPVAPIDQLPEVESLRCLVVDDESAVASVLGDVLEASGHRVVVLTDGAEAIARVQAEPFDVVFTDLAMPRVSGWDVAHAVKAATPGVPVFLVTGFGVELSAAERRAHGVAAVFSKPLRIEDITRAVAHVGRRGATDPPEDHR